MKTVTAAVVIREKRVLIARRAAGQSNAGMWEFPGGKIEKNETPEECLARELKEELNVESTIHEKITESAYTYDHGSFVICAYKVTLNSEIQMLTVHDEIKWVDVDNVREYPLSPADIPIAEHIIAHKNDK
jgi:8-oxo-dGTP diphosphatase